MNSTPHSERTNIAIFGRCNSGKSSLVNALTGQDVAIVSDKVGTTTDPVVKAMEITGVGACVIIDTAGIDLINRDEFAVTAFAFREGDVCCTAAFLLALTPRNAFIAFVLVYPVITHGCDIKVIFGLLSFMCFRISMLIEQSLWKTPRREFAYAGFSTIVIVCRVPVCEYSSTVVTSEG